MEKLLKSVRKEIWRFRFMLYWRTAAMVLVYIFLVFWLFVPMLFGMCLANSSFEFLMLPCMVAFFVNIGYISLEEEGVCKVCYQLLGKCRDLKCLITHGKYAVDDLKRVSSGEDIGILDDLYLRIVSIGIDIDEQTIIKVCAGRGVMIGLYRGVIE